MTDPTRLQSAIDLSLAHEVPWARDPQAQPQRFGVHLEDPPPWNRLRGPLHVRGGVSGVVWQHGREIAAWLAGETTRADAVAALQQATRNYAKRQLTWFRNQCRDWARA